MRRLYALLFLLCLPTGAFAMDEVHAALQLTDYLAVDYGGAVDAGRRIKDPAEYAEMREFSTRIQNLITKLPVTANTASIRQKASVLHSAILEKAGPAEVTAAARALSTALIVEFHISLTPATPPDVQRGKRLYHQFCVGCHGADGRGDGPEAASLRPPPVNFHDRDRAMQHNLFGLYNTISLGLAGTSMPAYGQQLSKPDRWALAFYVGNFFAAEHELRQGESSWNDGKDPKVPLDLQTLAGMTPNAVLDRFGQAGLDEFVWLRAHPGMLADNQAGAPVQISIRRIKASRDAYLAGHHEQAYNLAVSAYLEGFELAEAGLQTVAPGVKTHIEHSMIAYREKIRHGADNSVISQSANTLVEELQNAAGILAGDRLSPGMTFISALIILAREGLEAILVLGAIAAFMNQTGRNDAMKYLHIGWILALLAGALTWAFSSYVIHIDGSARELTEGVTGLVAAGILFYVGFWMHNKINASRWNAYISTHLHSALSSRTLWSLTLVSFIAVYREIFETILFYETLWLQVSKTAQPLLFAGAGSALVLLGFLAWGIFKLGIRLPLKLFFGISGWLMFVLAFVFAGKGVAALQEAGKVPIDTVPFPRLEWLGIYPTVQSLGVQILLVALLFALMGWRYQADRRKKRLP